MNKYTFKFMSISHNAMVESHTYSIGGNDLGTAKCWFLEFLATYNAEHAPCDVAYVTDTSVEIEYD